MNYNKRCDTCKLKNNYICLNYDYLQKKFNGKCPQYEPNKKKFKIKIEKVEE